MFWESNFNLSWVGRRESCILLWNMVQRSNQISHHCIHCCYVSVMEERIGEIASRLLFPRQPRFLISTVDWSRAISRSSGTWWIFWDTFLTIWARAFRANLTLFLSYMAVRYDVIIFVSFYVCLKKYGSFIGKLRLKKNYYTLQKPFLVSFVHFSFSWNWRKILRR